MDFDLTRFARFTRDDNPPSCPRISFSVEASQRVSTTLPARFYITVSREKDGINQPVIFNWSSDKDTIPWLPFLLLQHTSNGLEKVKVEDLEDYAPKDTKNASLLPQETTFWQLKPGEETTRNLSLPEKIHQALMPGHKYTLYWPGDEVRVWSLVTSEEGRNQALSARPPNDPMMPRLVMPAGPFVTFRVENEAIPWPDRDECEANLGWREANYREYDWRRKNMLLWSAERPPKQRLPGSPVFALSIKGPTEVIWYKYAKPIKFDLTLTYEGVFESIEVARPVTFHTLNLQKDRDRLIRGTEIGWERCEVENGEMLFVDDPDIPVKVGDREEFQSLKPGESWTWEEDVGSRYDEAWPNDVKVGDVFRYTFTETTLDWWDWGSKEDHAETVVDLPCFLSGPVQKPKHNGGRPELMILTSNTVEFRIVGIEKEQWVLDEEDRRRNGSSSEEDMALDPFD